MQILLLLLSFLFQAHCGNVFAHFMMGNAYPGTVDTFANNIQMAVSAGIDAFALNIGPDDWMPDRISKMFQAAKQFPSFKLFISFDMAVMGNDPNPILNYVRTYSKDSSSFFYQGKYFMSTFAGESTTFGAGSVNDGWNNLIRAPLAAEGIQIYFVPSFTAAGPVGFYNKFPSLDGAFSWAAWPNDNSQKTTDEDNLYISAGAPLGKSYMAAISPWFFTHFSYKNWIYKSETLFPTRWQQILNLKTPFVEIITWNDYGESHYLTPGPLPGDDMPPEARVWSTGFDHSGWLDLSIAYIKAYKSGSNTPIIESEKVYFWHRVHSKNAQRNDALARPNNADWADDVIVIHTQLFNDADVVVNVGGVSSSFHVGGGANTNTVPFGQGTVTVSVSRGGVQVGSATSTHQIVNAGDGYNFNPTVSKFSVSGGQPVAQPVAVQPVAQPVAQPIQGPISCSISYNLATVPSSGSFNINVQYSTPFTAKLIVDLLDTVTYANYATGNVIVQTTSSATATVTVQVDIAPPTDKPLVLSVWLVDVNLASQPSPWNLACKMVQQPVTLASVAQPVAPVAQPTNAPTNPPTNAPVAQAPTFTYLGCGVDSSNRALPNDFTSSDQMTNELCGNYCKSKGYSIFGTEYEKECYCGNVALSQGTAPETECASWCPGNINERCGGGWRLSFYRINSGSGNRVEDPSTQGEQQPTTNNGGLGTGQIVGIALGAVGCLFVIVVLVVFMMRKKSSDTERV